MTYLKRAFIYITGLLISSLGVSLTIKADVGVGAWDALNVGLSKFAFTVGTWVIIVGTILIFVNALLAKKMPDFTGFITIFIMGPCIDFWLWLFTNFNPANTVFRYALLIFGLTLLALGISVYLNAKFAPNPIDNLMLALHERLKLSMGVTKTIGELLALVFALIVKGPIWIGTIIVTIGIGPIIQFFYPKIEKLVQK